MVGGRVVERHCACVVGDLCLSMCLSVLAELVVEWNSANYTVAEGDGAVEVQLVAEGRYEIAFFLLGGPQRAKSTLVGGRDLGLAMASSGAWWSPWGWGWLQSLYSFILPPPSPLLCSPLPLPLPSPPLSL